MLRIALIGASGNAGSCILKELSDRGHSVTAIARNPERIAALPGVTAVQADAQDKAALSKVLAGHDAVVSAAPFVSTDPQTLIDAVRNAGVKRYLVVGGAGSLEIAPGQRVIDLPDFPDAYRPEAARGAAFLERLKQEQELDWSFLSPSAEFVHGERTGVFRLGKDRLLSNEQGSRISFEDYAIALVDEIEEPKHSRQRFTVGY
ncbi:MULTISPECIES: NAD(P)-dependent oxidoreductase [Pseudomonas]|uniref:NAD(P)-dependent oxidoreductase n=1 Tax=Pseudomonas TaxID=286 RepID=UPI00137B2E9A|nr:MULTISPECIES: NAD(P)-dependent oxidoreductase [Pseudomonas]